MTEVMDPIHGTIILNDYEYELLRHPLVARLKFISQLGTAQFVFPSATHTRFSHSIGVVHIAERFFLKLFRPFLESKNVQEKDILSLRDIFRFNGAKIRNM
jgi:HD superfamily phosphohydrolase